MRALNGFSFSNVASSQQFTLTEDAGDFLMEVIGTGFGTVELQKLGPDGSTYLSLKAPFNNTSTEADLIIGSFAANGSKVLRLSPGKYQVTIATTTAVYVRISRIPGE